MNCTPVAVSTHAATPKSPISTVNPLCIILVKNGSKGDRLLFRYPYSKKAKTAGSRTSSPIRKILESQTEEQVRNSSFASSTGTKSEGFTSATSPTPSQPDSSGKPVPIPVVSTEDQVDGPNSSNLNPVGLETPSIPSSLQSLSTPVGVATKSPAFIGTTTKSLFDTPLSQLSSKTFTSPNEFRTRKVSRTTAPVISRGDGENPYSVSKNPSDDLFAEPGFYSSTADGRKFSLDGSEMLSQLSDKDLSNLLAVNSDLAERKFELKLNFVRFVGHPTLMHNHKDVRPINPE